MSSGTSPFGSSHGWDRIANKITAERSEAPNPEPGQEPPTPDAIPTPVLDDPFDVDEWESTVVAQAKAQERERIEQAIARIDYSGGGWLIDDLINAVYEAITQAEGGDDE